METTISGSGFRVCCDYGAEAKMVMPKSRFERAVLCDMLP